MCALKVGKHGFQEKKRVVKMNGMAWNEGIKWVIKLNAITRGW